MATWCIRRHLFTSTRGQGRVKFPYFNIQQPIPDPKYLDYTYFEKEARKLEFGPTYIDDLGKLWYQRETYTKAMKFRGADKLVGHRNFALPELDDLEPVVEFEDVPALENAPESVKKIFSVKFAHWDAYTEKMKRLLVAKVSHSPIEDLEQELAKDDGDLAIKIAVQTAEIRCMMKRLEPIPFTAKKMRNHVLYLIADRHENLLALKDEDRGEFDRVVEVLDINFYEPPLPEHAPLTTRKGWCEHECKLKRDEVKRQKLKAYHDRLKQERVGFLDYKERTLDRLDKEEQDLLKELDNIYRAKGHILGEVKEYQPGRLEEISETVWSKPYYKGIIDVV